jgi:class 3 adenylate cyclase
MAGKRLAILFADVCDSTTIYESIGDTRALASITRLFTDLMTKVKAGGGKVVKTLGDGMVCEFKSADAAFRAACQLQQTATAAEAHDGPKLTIKVGFNFGPVVTEGGDVFGDTVNVCARLATLAGPHQVLTTRQTLDALSPALRSRSRQLHALKVRGRVEEVNVCEVLWRAGPDPDVTESLSHSALSAAAKARNRVLKLTYGRDNLVVQPSDSVNLGRDKTNDVVVSSTKASRVHARIYGRGSHFILVDQSSNGTFVSIDGQTREIELRREETMLGERGTISLGGPADKDGDHVLRYKLENRKAPAS